MTSSAASSGMGQAQSQSEFLADVQQYLRTMPDQDPPTWHVHSRKVLQPLVNSLSSPNLSPQPQTAGAVFELETDGFELTSDEAKEFMADAEEINVPVFTKEKLASTLTESSPLDQLLSWFPSGKEAVEVQIASDLKSTSGTRSVTISDIRKRFQLKQSKSDPWNILGIHSPLPDAALPTFLHNHNCSLLSDIARLHMIRASTAKQSRAKGCHWQQMMSWVLLAEAGALTTPHQDACGLSTWIHCYQGNIGFAWLSRPDENELQEWRSNPDGFRGGRWCYRMLQAGDVVYLDPGLVHFVIRRPGANAQTMAIGGHILRRSAIGSWARVLHQQTHSITKLDLVYPQGKDEPLPFNEDLSSVLHCAPVLLDTVNRLKQEIVKELGREKRDEELTNHLCSSHQLKEFEQFYPLSRNALEAMNILREQSAEIDDHSASTWSESVTKLLAKRKPSGNVSTATTLARPADMQWKLVRVKKANGERSRKSASTANEPSRCSKIRPVGQGLSSTDRDPSKTGSDPWGAESYADDHDESGEATNDSPQAELGDNADNEDFEYSVSPLLDSDDEDDETTNDEEVDEDLGDGDFDIDDVGAEVDKGAKNKDDRIEENITVASRRSAGAAAQTTNGDEQLARAMQGDGKRIRTQVKPPEGTIAWTDPRALRATKEKVRFQGERKQEAKKRGKARKLSG